MKQQIKQFKSDVLKLATDAFDSLDKEKKKNFKHSLHKYSEATYRKYVEGGFEKMEKEFGLEPNPDEKRSEYDQLCEFAFQTFMIGLVHTTK